MLLQLQLFAVNIIKVKQIVHNLLQESEELLHWIRVPIEDFNNRPIEGEEWGNEWYRSR